MQELKKMKELTQKIAQSSEVSVASHSVETDPKKEVSKKLGCATSYPKSSENLNLATLWLKMSKTLLDTRKGLPIYKHAWKKLDMKEGPSVIQLASTARHIKGNASSSSTSAIKKYLTPLASDGHFLKEELTTSLRRAGKISGTEEAYPTPEFAAWLMGVSPKLKSIIMKNAWKSSEMESRMTKVTSSAKPSNSLMNTLTEQQHNDDGKGAA